MEDDDVINAPSKFMQLLDKRQTLLRLRKEVLYSRSQCEAGKRQDEEDRKGESNPDTPQSSLQSSNNASPAPPLFSPLTPLLVKRNSKKQEQQDASNPGTPLSHILVDPLLPSSSFLQTMNEETVLSPLPLMSPETKNLYDILVSTSDISVEKQSSDIIENSYESNSDHTLLDGFNSDDSIAGPDFNITMRNTNLVVSESECDSTDSDKDYVVESETECESNDESKDLRIRRLKTAKKNSNMRNVIRDIDDSFSHNSEVLASYRPPDVEDSLSQNSEVLLASYIPPDIDDSVSQNPEVLVPQSGPGTGRSKKGRKRKTPQSRPDRRYNKYHNLEYTTESNKNVKPKVFIDFQCGCNNNCPELISTRERKIQFDKFVKLGSFNAQLLYISSCITEKPKKRTCTLTSIPPEKKKPKQFSRIYTINNVKVCRNMFLKTFQISTQRVTVALKKMRNNDPVYDRRGSNGGWNKISEEDLNFIVGIISKLPQYESHYRREKNSDTRYLRMGMTMRKIYEIYVQEYKKAFGDEAKCISYSTVNKIFLTKFNLRCKSLKKDTCNKCDMFAMKLKDAKTTDESQKIKDDMTAHQDKATYVRDQMNADFQTAKDSETIECLSFDLEKTLPLPRIPTNLVFYKRQLWVYNSGIHSASDDVGHCFVWVEGEAGRGAQEVGSCLMKFIENKLRNNVEHLILWSDCCGGQNRNIKIVLLLKAVMDSHPTLQTISFRYLESGHSFLPNDTDFSKIETALKHQQCIYTAEGYMDIFKNAKKMKPLQVTRMQKSDLYSTKNIEKNITNRKKFTDTSKVNWLATKEILIKKDNIFSVFMRTSFQEEFKELNIKKRGFTISKSDLELLWPDGKPIAPAKLADLKTLYPYIPEASIDYYHKLQSSDEITDDVDGFSGPPDFEIALENED